MSATLGHMVIPNDDDKNLLEGFQNIRAPIRSKVDDDPWPARTVFCTKVDDDPVFCSSRMKMAVSLWTAAGRTSMSSADNGVVRWSDDERVSTSPCRASK